MANFSKGTTFGSTETVTNTKLHNLIDLASITGILNADCDASMALANSKLANIVDGGKVSGSSMFNLASIPSGAGQIPNEFLQSIASIPNSALMPITLASMVSGSSLFALNQISTLASYVPLANLGNVAFSAIEDYGTSASSSTSKLQSELKVCFGSLSVAADTTSTISNLPFTSSSTYSVIATIKGNDTTLNSSAHATNTSGAACTVTNPWTDSRVIAWIAIGT